MIHIGKETVMNLQSNPKIKTYLLIGLFSFILAWGSSVFSHKSHAKKTISVTVGVDKQLAKRIQVFGLGFMVNNKRRGGMGTRTTKSGPAYATYSFGFKQYRGKQVSCGSSVLKEDCDVVLYYQGNRCHHKVFPKN